MPGDDDTALQFPVLIGDIGGTNARFSIVLDANSEPTEPQIVQTANFKTIDEAIQTAVLD
ncbi:MAG: glucokinase, partial [Mesorhizobium sp.]